MSRLTFQKQAHFDIIVCYLYCHLDRLRTRFDGIVKQLEMFVMAWHDCCISMYAIVSIAHLPLAMEHAQRETIEMCHEHGLPRVYKRLIDSTWNIIATKCKWLLVMYFRHTAENDAAHIKLTPADYCFIMRPDYDARN